MNSAIDPAKCPFCREPNACQRSTSATAQNGPCWCASIKLPSDLLARVPANALNKSCICQRCVEASHSNDCALPSAAKLHPVNPDASTA